MGSEVEDDRSERRGDAVTHRPLYRVEIHDDIAHGRRAFADALRRLEAAVFAAGSVLDGDYDGVFLLRTGWACRSRELPDGRRVILDFHLPGELAGLGSLLLARPRDTLRTLTAVRCTVMPLAVLRRLQEDPCIALYLLSAMGEMQWRLDRRAVALARMEAHERVAMMLLDFYDRLRRRQLAAACSFNLPLTQRHMADYLGLTVVHVNRMLRRLREERIAIIDRDMAMIRDLPRLRVLAGAAKSFAVPDATPPADEALARLVPG